MIQNKIKSKINLIYSFIFKQNDIFAQEMPSDLALCIILFAKILAGVIVDKKNFSDLLKNIHFEKWSNIGLKLKLAKLCREGSVLEKVLAVIRNNQNSL